MLTLSLLWDNRAKVLVLALLLSLGLSWHLQKRIGELSVKPLTSINKDVRTVKGPVRIVKTVSKKNGETITQTITDRAPETSETHSSKEEKQPTPVNQNKYLVGCTAQPLEKKLESGHVGYSWGNRVDLLLGFRPKDSAVLTTLILRF